MDASGANEGNDQGPDERPQLTSDATDRHNDEGDVSERWGAARPVCGVGRLALASPVGGPVPRYDAADEVHRELARLCNSAERVAVDWLSRQASRYGQVAASSRIRSLLDEQGILTAIDGAAAEMLPEHASSRRLRTIQCGCRGSPQSMSKHSHHKERILSLPQAVSITSGMAAVAVGEANTSLSSTLRASPSRPYSSSEAAARRILE